MLRLKPITRVAEVAPQKTTPAPKKEKAVKESKEDKYNQPEFDPIITNVNEYTDLHFEVRRMYELGLPHLDIRHWSITDVYKGPSKKAVTIPVEKIQEVIDLLTRIKAECEKRDLMYYEDEQEDED